MWMSLSTTQLRSLPAPLMSYTDTEKTKIIITFKCTDLLWKFDFNYIVRSIVLILCPTWHQSIKYVICFKRSLNKTVIQLNCLTNFYIKKFIMFIFFSSKIQRNKKFKVFCWFYLCFQIWFHFLWRPPWHWLWYCRNHVEPWSLVWVFPPASSHLK